MISAVLLVNNIIAGVLKLLTRGLSSHVGRYGLTPNYLAHQGRTNQRGSLKS